MSITKDDQYELVDPPSPMRNCACCGWTARLWKDRRDRDCLYYLPECSNQEALCEDLGVFSGGCPLADWRGDFLTKKAAVTGWNEYNNALEESRKETPNA